MIDTLILSIYLVRFKDHAAGRGPAGLRVYATFWHDQRRQLGNTGLCVRGKHNVAGAVLIKFAGEQEIGIQDRSRANPATSQRDEPDKETSPYLEPVKFKRRIVSWYRDAALKAAGTAK